MIEPVDKPQLADIEPEEAINEAVRAAVSNRLQGLKHAMSGTEDFDSVLARATSKACTISSLEVLAFLARNEPEIFKNLLIITSYDVSEKIRRMGMEHHTYFLVEDKNGFWSSGSPANHGLNGDSNYATTVFKDHDLSTVLDSIEARDEMNFPTKSQILHDLRYRKSFTVNGDSVDILSINLVEGDTFFEYKQIPTKRKH